MPNPVRRRRLGGSPYPNMGARFVAASAQSFTIADNATLSIGAGNDMTLACWVNLATAGTGRTVVCKYQTSGQFEYLLWYNTTSFRLNVTANGTAATFVDATNFGSATANTWNMVVCQYDGTNIKIGVNNGTMNTAAFSTDIFDGTSRFGIGNNDTPVGAMDGGIDCVGLWKTSRGSGGALSAAQITDLYRNGVGLAYRDLSASLRTGLVAWWDLDGSAVDRVGGLAMTSNAGAGFGAGKR